MKSSELKQYSVSVFMCVQDLISALGERPKIYLFFIRLLMGKYAWHELIAAKRLTDLYCGFDRANLGYSDDLKEYSWHRDEAFQKWDYRPDWGKSDTREKERIEE